MQLLAMPMNLAFTVCKVLSSYLKAKVLSSSCVVSSLLSGEAFQFCTFVLPFSYELLLYSVTRTVKSCVAISFVMVTHDV